MSKVLATNGEQARRIAFETAVMSQHALAVRTAEALRKVVLFDTPGNPKTNLEDFTKGQVDPQLQLVLMARDCFLASEDPTEKLGFFKTTRDIFLNVDAKTTAAMELIMRERHHREKLEAFERKEDLKKDWTDEEVDAAAGEKP